MIGIELALLESSMSLSRVLSLSLAVTHCGGVASLAPVCSFLLLFFPLLILLFDIPVLSFTCIFLFVKQFILYFYR